MVRSFILNDEQRDAINEYLDERPSAMSPQIRQIRLRAKRLDFTAMREDLELLERLANLRIPKGRKSADLEAHFTVRARGEEDIPGKFTVSGYGKVLNDFMESGEQVSVIPKDAEIPFFPLSSTLRQRLNRVIKRLGLPIRATVRNDEVYLERTDKTEEK